MKKDIKNLNKFTSDFIVSSKGQLDYPGMNTLIPNANGRITMKGVKQNVLGIDDLGNKKIMKPKGEYQFPGDSVYEIPLKKKGGEFKKGLVSNPKKTKKSLASKKYSRSLSATNVLFTENSLFKKPKSRKNKVYNPNAKYYEKGGALLTKKVTCKKCGWKWDAEDGGNDITTCHECGGQGLVHAQDGGNTDAMTGMMKARLAYANEFGNPAAERMINIPDNPYQFDNGDTGTHYMASMDNYAVPQIQDENGVLQLGDYGPESNEAIRFDSDEDANYFAEHYKDVSPGFLNEKQYGGLHKFVDGGSSSCSKDEVWDKYSKKCVKVYTLANDKKFIDGVGNWAMHSNDPDKISFEYNDQIKHYLYSGKYGYDPVSGTLYPLKKEQKTIADVETKKILAKQENKATYTQSIIDAGFDPDTFGKSKGTNVITGEKIYGDKSQEDVNEINKEAINNFVTEGHKKAILDSPFNTAAFFTPSGIAAGVMQGAANLVPDTYDFGKDPSWSGAGAIAMDALMMSPTFKNLGKFLKVPKQLPGSPNSFELFDLNNVRKPSGSIGNQGATPESANKILQSLGIKVKGKIPNEVSLKEMVEHLKNNPKDALKYKKFLENKPINVSELPGGEYQINDGHHRATLSYYSGNENIPAIIKNKGEYITQLPGSPNVVSSVDDVQKAGFLNPLALIDRVTPRPPMIGTTFPTGVLWDDPVNYSPFNLIPGYGRKLAEPGFTKGMNSTNTEITAYRKFGNSLDDLINSKSFKPEGGFRMGAKQIQKEGNWAEPGIANEHYKGVFAAGMNPRVEGTNIQLQHWPTRNGVVGMTKQGNPAIPITDPGLSFHRRLPFSNRYVPIDKQKLIDNKFQLATQLPHVQSLIEKYGIAAAYALTFGYLANGKEGAIENLKTVNKYSIDPIKNWSKKTWDELETTLNEKQYGGITKFDDGGTVYTVKGSKGYYKKVNGQWQVDWNRSGKYQPLSKGDVKARTAVLNKMAKPAYDKDYDEMVAYKNLSTKDKINKFEPKKEATKEELKKVSERLGRDYKPEDTKLQSVNMVYPEKYIIGPGGGLLNQGLKIGVGAIEKLAATKIPGLFGTTVGQAAGAGFAADALVNQFPGAISDIGKGEYEDAAEKALYGTLGLAGSGIGKGVVSGAKDLGKFLGTDSGVLSNAYKINPYAFKPDPSKFYRQIGNAGLEDAVSSKIIRSADQSTFPRPYFVEGKDFEKLYSTGSGAHGRPNVIFETPGITNEGLPFVSPANASADYTPWIANMAEVPLTEGRLLKQNWLKGYKEVPKQLPGSPNVVSSVDDVVKQPWQMEELPGLHLQSTMEGEAISKIVDKTGKINTEQALAIIAKESGGADKVALIKQGLGETIPKKIDFNDFRKITQEQLIPLERQFVDYASDYGINRLGYKEPEFITRNVNGKTINELTSDVIENQTLVLSNKGKFGRGSSAHGNPEETLGHVHFLRDSETPDVLTVTQIQSDAFQGTHRVMPKNIDEAFQKVNSLKEEGKEIKSMFGDGKESSNSVLANYEKHLQLEEASAKNFTQKQLLDKNHQERYLQELVDYAGKRGDVNKLRLPTSETAAKVQGYSKVKIDDNSLLTSKEIDELKSLSEKYNKMPDDVSDDLWDNVYDPIRKRIEEINVKRAKETNYSSEHQTILKKYSEQPKLIKKLFKQDAKTITDNKGNTWYEFNIPEKFKKGKGEIKAFSTIGTGVLGLGLGAAQYKQGGATNDYVELDLTPEEIQKYIDGGYIVEEIN